MFHINNMTQMSCNFKEQGKIVRTGEIPLWGEGPEPSQATWIAYPLPHPPAKRWVLVACFPRGGAKDAKNTPENQATKVSGFRGEGGVSRGLI